MSAGEKEAGPPATIGGAAGPGGEAQRRAKSAGDRAAALHEALLAFTLGSSELHGSTTDELAAARAHADDALIRLRTALERSAAAHERAAKIADRAGPGESAGRRAQEHRAAAEADRRAAAELRVRPYSPDE